MMIYKPGDKVRILKAVGYEGEGLSHLYDIGDICEVYRQTDTDGDTRVYTKDKSHWRYFAQDAIAPATPSWDCLQVGDVIVYGDGYEAVVLEVGASGKTFLRSNWNDFDGVFEWLHIEQAKKRGWKLKGAEAPEELVEITLDEIAKIKGVDVSKIRVKE